MATRVDEELFNRLRASGLRKRMARTLATATDRRRKPAKQVNGALDDLKKLVAEVEDRVSGGPARRSAAAKKAAKTRRDKAKARSIAARKGARTRSKTTARSR